MSEHEHIVYDTIIIGGGVAGLAGGMYAGRLTMKTLVLGDDIGGTIALTDVVENYPGFKKVTGQELADKMREHVKDYSENVKIMEDKAVKIEKCRDKCFTVHTEKQSFHTKSLIIATGTKHRKLGVSGEEKLANKGVHTCALCDGPIYKGKIVAVVGGSDSAAKEALLLTQWAEKVYIIYRREKIRPEPINMRRVEEKIKQGKIEIISNTNVKEIKGDAKVTGVVLDKLYKGSTEFSLDALFIEIGLIPQSELAVSIGVNTNKKGEIIMDRESKTNLPGVFVAGDVGDTKFKQAITGAAEAVMAAYSAYSYLSENNIICTCNEED